MPKRFPSKLKRIIFNYDWEIVEVQGSVFKIIWGAWLILPFDTFAGNVVYNALSSITSELWWGIFVFGLGFVHLTTIAYGSRIWRRRLIMVATMFWIFLSVIFALSRVGSALIPLTLVIAFFLGVNYLRLGLPNIPASLRRRLGYDV